MKQSGISGLRTAGVATGNYFAAPAVPSSEFASSPFGGGYVLDLVLFPPICLSPMLQAVKSLLTPQPTSALVCGGPLRPAFFADHLESSAKGTALLAGALVRSVLRKLGRGERGGVVTGTQGSWLAPEL